MSRGRITAVYALGAAASMAQEMIWVESLSRLYGGATLGLTLGIAVYVTGLAAGARLTSALTARGESPGRWLVRSQCAAGVLLAASPLLFAGLEWIDAAFGAAATPLRLIAPALLLLLPATCLGALYPLVSGYGARRLYGIGLAASAAGALGAGLVTLPSLGIAASCLLFGAVQCVAGLLARDLRPEEARAGTGGETARVRAGALARAAILGGVLFAAHAAWWRTLSQAADATIHAEVVMLVAVLIWMAAGAALIGRSDRAAAVSAVVAAAHLAMLVTLPGRLAGWSQELLGPADTLGDRMAALTLVVSTVVAPASVAVGALMARLVNGHSRADVARLWTWHNVGGTVGLLSAALAALPTLGIAAVLATAAALLVALRSPRTALRRPALTVGIAAAAAVALAFGGDAARRSDVSARGIEIVLEREGLGGLVEVWQRPDGVRELRSSRLRREGADGSESVVVARLQGQLPSRIVGPVERSLVIGLGTGVSLDAHARIAGGRTTCVELSPEIVEAAEAFDHVNRGVLDRDGVDVVVADGRRFVRTNGDRYDLIVQELFFPYRRGTAAMYSRDHYARCRERLVEGGRVAQWISLAQIAPDDLRCLARGFADVFPHASAWVIGGYLMLLGGDAPVPADAPPLALRHLVLDDASLWRWCGDGDRNTDDRLLLEHRVPSTAALLDTTELTVRNIEALLPHWTDGAGRDLNEGITAEFRGRRAKALSLYAEAMRRDASWVRPRTSVLRLAHDLAAWALAVEAAPGDLPGRVALAAEAYARRDLGAALAHLAAVDDAEVSRSKDALLLYGNCLARQGRALEAVARYEAVLAIDPDHSRARNNLDQVRQSGIR